MIFSFIFTVCTGAFAYSLITEPVNYPGCGGTAFVGLLFVCATAFCLYGSLYASRYRIQLEDDSITVTNAFHTRSIALSRIAQVITISTPRGGTNSFLLDINDGVLGKIDGSLVGYVSFIANLGQKLRPYHATLYKSGTWGPWEMQVAGDTHWVPSAAPRLARMNGRRQAILLVITFCLIAGFMAAASALEHGGFDKWLGH